MKRTATPPDSVEEISLALVRDSRDGLLLLSAALAVSGLGCLAMAQWLIVDDLVHTTLFTGLGLAALVGAVILLIKTATLGLWSPPLALTGGGAASDPAPRPPR